MSQRSVLLFSTGLVGLGLILSLLGLAGYAATPPQARTWAPIIPAIATAGLTIAGALIITRAPLSREAGALWRKAAQWTALAIIAATIILAFGAPLPSVLMAIIALQGPLAAEIVGRKMEGASRRDEGGGFAR